jgi:hypothetical protein
MPNPSSAIVAALQAAQNATLSPSVVRASGAGKAYQSVAQSTAITVQDASDYLRNVMTISSVAYGVAMALTAAGNPQATPLLDNANKIVTNAAAQFKTVGLNAAAVLKAFPSS